MIYSEVENEIFTKIKNAITSYSSSIYVRGSYEPVLPGLPCVYVECVDISTNTKNLSGAEKITALMYEINVFVSALNSSKTNAKSIMDIVDNQFILLGFNRVSLSPIPNYDNSIYRITARYEAAISTNNTIYRR